MAKKQCSAIDLVDDLIRKQNGPGAKLELDEITDEQRRDMIVGKPVKASRKPKKEKEGPPQAPVTDSKADKDDQFERIRKFFTTLKNSKISRIYIGLDTGISGALAFYCPVYPGMTTVVDLPIMKLSKSGKTKAGNKRTQSVFDEAEIWRYVQEWMPLREKIIVCIEATRAMPIDTATTAHRLGYALGLWPMFLMSHGFAYMLVEPAVWKKDIGLTGKNKEYSRWLAQRRFPAAVSMLSRVKDDGRAEALLLCEFAQRAREGRG